MAVAISPEGKTITAFGFNEEVRPAPALTAFVTAISLTLTT
jgi:hypothetical protein